MSRPIMMFYNPDSYISETCQFGRGVDIGRFKSLEMDPAPKICIADNVKIGANVAINIDGALLIEEGVTIHKNVSILGSGNCTIRKGTWIAQYTNIDCEGGVDIGEECCIGFNCQIWSHVARVPRLPNMRFHSTKKTVLKDRVWLMGGLITVSPGVTIAEDCVIFSNSVVSKDTIPGKVYAGIPAILLDKYDSPYIS